MQPLGRIIKAASDLILFAEAAHLPVHSCFPPWQHVCAEIIHLVSMLHRLGVSASRI